MELEVIRFSSQSNDSLSLLHDVTDRHLIAGLRTPKFLCFGLEDGAREIKVPGETRIPAGRYPIKLREEGGRVNPRYASRFPSIHKGMLHIQDVPNFTWIYIHCGNKEADTAACYLVGDTCQQNITENGFIGSSGAAYQRIYPHITDALLSGEEVFITFKDYA